MPTEKEKQEARDEIERLAKENAEKLIDERAREERERNQ